LHPTDGPPAAWPEPPRHPDPTGTDLAAEVATLRDAIATRTIIGQATGLLAGQLSITTPVAWRVMRSLSNETNIKLRDIARALVDAHDGRRHGDPETSRAISAALGVALTRAQDGVDDDQDGPEDASVVELQIRP
jgi:hypothetical protein